MGTDTLIAPTPMRQLPNPSTEVQQLRGAPSMWGCHRNNVALGAPGGGWYQPGGGGGDGAVTGSAESAYADREVADHTADQHVVGELLVRDSAIPPCRHCSATHDSFTGRCRL